MDSYYTSIDYRSSVSASSKRSYNLDTFQLRQPHLPPCSPNPYSLESQMRVIRYTIVDSDPKLLEVHPSSMLLRTNWTTVVKGFDNQKFLMDLAVEMVPFLEDHNNKIKNFSWVDEEKKTHYFKLRKFSDLDVIIEVLRSY